MDQQLISVSNLTKRFKNFTAVDNISFFVNKKEIFAFLGPNGAGKSTTIKMLITLTHPTGGNVIINGFNILSHPFQVRKSIGYVPQLISVDSALTAYENLMLMARLYDLPRSIQDKRVRQILGFFQLEKFSNNLVRTFSGGMIRKLEIGQAILHEPKILFLDEPTSGLDPLSRRNVWKHLCDLRDGFGTTIFFSTHYMEEAQDVSDRVAIMHSGSIASIGSVSELIKKTKIKNATLEDAFIFFTGTKIHEGGNFKEIRRIRQTEKRLG